MFVAPLVISAPVASDRGAHANPFDRHSGRAGHPNVSEAAHAVLLCWMMVGLLVLLFVPAARGDGALGATLPFWLVIAPALDLIWLSRKGLFRAARARARRTTSTRRQARRARRDTGSTSVHGAPPLQVQRDMRYGYGALGGSRSAGAMSRRSSR